MKRTRTVTTLFLVLGLCGLAAGQSGMVHFKGTVTVAEQHEVVPVCYGSYFVEVGIEEVLEDDEALLGDVTSVEVCYAEEMGLKAGDQVLNPMVRLGLRYPNGQVSRQTSMKR